MFFLVATPPVGRRGRSTEAARVGAAGAGQSHQKHRPGFTRVGVRALPKHERIQKPVILRNEEPLTFAGGAGAELPRAGLRTASAHKWSEVLRKLRMTGFWMLPLPWRR